MEGSGLVQMVQLSSQGGHWSIKEYFIFVFEFVQLHVLRIQSPLVPQICGFPSFFLNIFCF